MPALAEYSLPKIKTALLFEETCQEYLMQLIELPDDSSRQPLYQLLALLPSEKPVSQIFVKFCYQYAQKIGREAPPGEWTRIHKRLGLWLQETAQNEFYPELLKCQANLFMLEYERVCGKHQKQAFIEGIRQAYAEETTARLKRKIFGTAFPLAT